VGEPVRIVPYDCAWPGRFEEERELLAAAIGGWVDGGIHHVGSTSVPGLAAKPVIDILAGVRSLRDARGCFDRLAGLGYMYAPYRPEVMHWFCKPHPSRRTHHLHLVPVGSARFVDELLFRDYLRAHAQAADEYVALKTRLAETFSNDREAYTVAKGDFILGVVQRARDGLARA
jgi:GrpB-like predicted nucleotidyltransferase (UPF0157 family)